jgi:hypothetical protein
MLGTHDLVGGQKACSAGDLRVCKIMRVSKRPCERPKRPVRIVSRVHMTLQICPHGRRRDKNNWYENCDAANAVPNASRARAQTMEIESGIGLASIAKAVW